MTEKVDGIRWMIEELDSQIMDLVKKRMEAALKMGKTKVEKAMPVRNLHVEDEVVGRYIMRAKEAGISKEGAAEIAQILIRESVEAQARLSRPMKMSKEVLIIGGAGQMGLWFARYMAMRGHKVKIYDPKPAKDFAIVKDLKAGIIAADVIILAVPIDKAPPIIDQLIEAEPKGLVFDIMSIKHPLIPQLKKAVEEGLTVCSVHPMFGPSALSMYSRNIVVCDCGSRKAVEEFLPLVDGMGCNVTEIPVDEHDKLISYVLGLSHAVNIAFFETLRRSGTEFKTLEDIASTTFRNQTTTSRKVANENPGLYYEIQHDNPHTGEVLEMFEQVVADLREAVANGDEVRFIEMMREGKEYYGDD